MMPSLAFPASTARSVILPLSPSPSSLRYLLSRRRYHQHSHLALRLRPQCQCRQATRLQLQRFSSTPSRQLVSLDTSDSQSWGKETTSDQLRLLAPAADRDTLERTCRDRNLPHAVKYPAEIERLSLLIKQLSPLKTSVYARRKAIDDLLKPFRLDKTSKAQTPLKKAALPLPMQDLVGMNEQQLMAEAKLLKEEIKGILEYENTLSIEIERLSDLLPNQISPETPRGTVPKIVSYINDDPQGSPSYSPRCHTEIGKELELIDLTMGASATGYGWYYLLNEAAQLEQALTQYALSVARRGGWSEVSPPSLVKSRYISDCGFQPRDKNGEQQVYSIQRRPKDEGKDELSLAGTAEIPLAAMLSQRTISQAHLPKRIVAVSRCYRAESGGRGVNSKGLYRVHEFTKVEMFAWTRPIQHESTAIFDEIQKIQIEILSSLGLYCRILEMPSTDLGAPATRKRDIEAFFPSRQTVNEGFGEVTSVSTCTDYQTARLKTTITERRKTSRPRPWTVNGTALAVPRVLAAILENGWNAERREVAIPECLWPWMDGVKVISSKLGPSGDSAPAAATEDLFVATEESGQPGQYQEDQISERAEEDDSTLEEQQNMIDGVEESDLVSGDQGGPITILEGDEWPTESQAPAPAVSVEQAEIDEVVAYKESSEDIQPAEPMETVQDENVLSDDTQSTQTAEETQTTDEVQSTEEAKPESPPKSLLSRLFGR